MSDPSKEKWYFKMYVFVIAFLCVGVFALPLVWLNPKQSRTKKVIISIIALVLTYFMWMVFADSMKTLMEYYRQLAKEIKG